MAHHLFIKRLPIPVSAAEAFAWHESPGALQKLIPPGDPVRLVSHLPGRQGPLGDGARVVLAIGRPPFALRWVARHEGYQRNRQFVDVQLHGPFALWRHTHRFIPVSESACVLEDHVEYALPLGPLGDAVAHRRVGAQIEKMFAWRHRATLEALTHHEPPR